MPESNHTEGPWQSQHDFDMEGVCRIIGAIDGPDDGRFHYRVVCEIDPDGSLDAKEQYANARLIAAAPDLYDVCRRTVDEFRAQQDDADAALAQHIAEHPASLVSLAFAALQRCSPQDTQS